MSPETTPQSPPPNGKFDPFSSSWLYPKEWNLSDLHNEQSQGSSESRPGVDGSNHDEEGPDEQLAANQAPMMPEIATATLDSYEPFQELRTIPSGWDLS